MDINKLMQQAQAMQKQLEEANRQISEKQFEGSASNGLVKVVINGDHLIQYVDLDASIIDPSDKEMIEDLIMIAVNDAIEKAEEYKKERLGGMASALGIPGK